MASRELTRDEAAVAREVFWASLSTGRIEVSDAIGLGDRPYTSCGLWTYTLNVGEELFRSGLTRTAGDRALLVHELTHAWQGQHGVLGFGYMLSSAFSQCRALVATGSTANAYDFRRDEEWDAFSSEQQASVVEAWYRSGMKTDDPCYKYIRDHVRKG